MLRVFANLNRFSLRPIPAGHVRLETRTPTEKIIINQLTCHPQTIHNMDNSGNNRYELLFMDDDAPPQIPVAAVAAARPEDGAVGSQGAQEQAGEGE